MKKITNATVSGMMNQACASCCCAITCDSVTLPASRMTAILHPGEHAPLGQREQRHPNQDQVEDHEHLDRRCDQEEGHATSARPIARANSPRTQAAGCAIPGAGLAW